MHKDNKKTKAARKTQSRKSAAVLLVETAGRCLQDQSCIQSSPIKVTTPVVHILQLQPFRIK